MASRNPADALFRRYRREAVLLHQPYPPHAGPRTNSHFGGLPRLPEDHAWPRASSGVPLHFLAQVDCADIPFKTALPERGVLFFFGRDDGEQVWDDDPPSSDDCRVLYALDAFALTPPRQPPADLPVFGRASGIALAWQRYPTGRDTESNVHVHWPIVPLTFDSFPDGSALPDTLDEGAQGWLRTLEGGFRRVLRLDDEEEDGDQEVGELYDEQLNARRVAALLAATGDRPREHDSTNAGSRAGSVIFGSDAAGPQAFPQHWAYIHYIATAIWHRPDGFAYGDAERAQLGAEAERWLERARQIPLDQPVAEEDRQALRAWLVGLKSSTDTTEMGYRAAELAFVAAVATIRTWAGDPERAALIPAHVYEACAEFFNGYEERDPQFSQMLGHAYSAQEARPVDDPTICLLNLDSDRGLGWGFGDGGQCTFWIQPGDLARRDFSRVVGTIVGH